MSISPPTTGQDRSTVDIEQLRHELNTPVTILHLRIQLLQRRLARRNGVPEESRLWLEEELATLLVAVKTLGDAIAAMPQSRAPDRIMTTLPVDRVTGRNVPDRPDAVSHGKGDHRSS